MPGEEYATDFSFPTSFLLTLLIGLFEKALDALAKHQHELE